MIKEKWIEVIKDFHRKEIPSLIYRDIEIPTNIPINRAVTIIGPRRAGKTYLMYQIISDLLKTIKKDQIIYVNLEKPSFESLSYQDLNKMLEVFYELYPLNRTKQVYLFLDEVQIVSGWERFVRGCLDDRIKVYITGSSSKMLSKEIATSMRGRTLTYQIFPFSFKEFLRAKEIEITNKLSSAEKSYIVNAFREYFVYGGYPETIIFSQEREKILSEILEVTIYKDVIERAKVRNIKVMRLLIDSLIVSKEFSINKFYNSIKSMNIKLGKNVLYKYVEYLNDAFFSFLLRKFSYSYIKAEQSIPKPYIIDNGFFQLKNFEDKSKLMENLVFLELLNRNNDIAYYSDIAGKIDFLIKKGKKVTSLMQVTYDISNNNTKEREIKSLIKCADYFKCKDLFIITWDEEKEETINNKKIKYIPLWKWLLGY